MESVGQYNATELQEKFIKRWRDIKLLEKRKKKNAMGKKFFYLDGPPYANAPPHMGHALTRTLRETICKYRLLKGENVWLQPGFDTHGLPVETMVQNELKLDSSDIEKFGIEKFNKACREHALKYLDLWGEFYEKFGSSSLWNLDNKYITFENDYIDSTWLFFEKAHAQDLLYKGQGSTPWCPHHQTGLAQHEVSQGYEDVTDTSIYLRFKINDKDNEYFLVWTTTPWTIPSNVAVAVHPTFTYAKVKVQDDVYILAKDLVESVMKKLGHDVYEVLEEMQGADLTNLTYVHPLENQVPVHKEFVHKTITEEYVTTGDGTGVVHTAPGHGPDDYNSGLKYNLRILSPVDRAGKYNEEAGPELKGKNVLKVNNEINEMLDHQGSLLFTEKITHSYPHCWRCRTKLIYITTPQWFIKIEPIKQRMLDLNSKIRWVPDWAGQKRFHDWLSNARDWNISRQRYWGIPIPVWECSDCDKLTVIGSVKELREKATNYKAGMDLHRPYIDEVTIKCENCGKESHRTTDVTDVWFDAGADTWAPFGYPRNEEFKKWFPVDFITEGLDQTRGWFYLMLVESTIVFNEAPFNSVLVNGLVLDAKGEKMSKSRGNVVAPFDVIEKFGPDIVRWFLLWASTPWDNVQWDEDNIRIIQNAMNTYWNVYNYAVKFMLLNGYTPKEPLPEKLEIEDKWILSRLQKLKIDTVQGYEKELNTSIPARALHEFIVNDLSRDYVKYIRSRVKENRNNEAVFDVLNKLLRETSIISSIIMPFASDEIYTNLTGNESVHLETFPEANDEMHDEKLEEQFIRMKQIMESALALRNEIGMKVRQPLQDLVIVSDSPVPLAGVEHIMKEQLNVHEIKHAKEAPKGDYAEAQFGSGTVYLNKQLNDELRKEGATRDLIRTVQQLRKQLGLQEPDHIKVEVIAPRDFKNSVALDEVQKTTNSDSINVVEKKSLAGEETKAKIAEASITVVAAKV